MNSNVHFVHPLHETGLCSHAESLWFAGDYTACLAELEAQPESAERFLLAARAYYRLRRPDEALGSLAAGHDLFVRTDEQAEADALSAVLHESKGNQRESDVFYERAFARDPRGAVGRANNMLALRAWMRDDIETCLRRLRHNEASSDPNVRAYAINLRSWTYASRRQFANQARLLHQTIETTLTAEQPDVGLIAVSLQALSARCREMHLPDEFAALCETADSLRWTPDLREQEYNTLRHIALTHALRGQYVVGLRQLQRVHTLAANAARRALSLLDSAWVALASEEKNAAQAHLQHALDLIERIDWSNLVGSETSTLLLAAEVACAFDPAVARGLLDRYEALKGSVPIQVGVRHDRSFDPIQAYTRARVVAISDVGPARKLAKQAYREFAAMRYQWRAARCALFLYEHGCGDTWLAAAKEQAEHYPRSFIGARLQRIDYESSFEPLARLTPRQRDVVRLLAEGDTVDDVAAALKTSPSTVRVHLKHIHRALGVRNRIELLRAVKRPA